jgi:hypothetical protein
LVVPEQESNEWRIDLMPYIEYRISPELRRCWYVIFGVAVLAGVHYWVGRFVQGRGLGDIAIGWAMFAAVDCAVVAALDWRLRLDESGMARRRWFVCGDHWSWDDLASGRIGKLHPYTLADPIRPWWRRRLNLGCLAADDIQAVFAVINAHYRLPPPPDLPERMTIKFGNFFRRSAVFDGKGIDLLSQGTHKAYRWDEVCGVYITRMDPLRRDFKILLIGLPDQEIDLRLISTLALFADEHIVTKSEIHAYASRPWWRIIKAARRW